MQVFVLPRRGFNIHEGKPYSTTWFNFRDFPCTSIAHTYGHIQGLLNHLLLLHFSYLKFTFVTLWLLFSHLRDFTSSFLLLLIFGLLFPPNLSVSSSLIFFPGWPGPYNPLLQPLFFHILDSSHFDLLTPKNFMVFCFSKVLGAIQHFFQEFLASFISHLFLFP